MFDESKSDKQKIIDQETIKEYVQMVKRINELNAEIDTLTKVLKIDERNIYHILKTQGQEEIRFVDYVVSPKDEYLGKCPTIIQGLHEEESDKSQEIDKTLDFVNRQEIAKKTIIISLEKEFTDEAKEKNKQLIDAINQTLQSFEDINSSVRCEINAQTLKKFLKEIFITEDIKLNDEQKDMVTKTFEVFHKPSVVVKPNKKK